MSANHPNDASLDRVVAALTAKNCNPRKTQGAWEAHCPAHDDKHRSLSIAEGQDGRVLIKCHAGDGCSIDKIVAELGLQTRDLFADSERSKSGGRGKITATYDYTNEAGKLLYQVVRFTPKGFRQRRPDGNGGWIWKLGRTRRVLYRLPAVLDAITKGETIYIVEGEKDADAGARAGVCATTSPMGAGKWNRKEYSETLRHASRIVIVADKDPEGDKHVAQVGRGLRRHGNRGDITIAKAKTGKDLFDHLEAGHTIDELQVFARVDGVRADETESLTPGATDGDREDESARESAGNSDTGDTDGDMPDLDLDADQARSVEKLMEQMKELDPDNQKDFLKELTKLVGKTNQATELVTIAKDAGVDLWHDPDGNGYATIPAGDHVEHWPIRSRSFRLWLRRRYYENTESAAGANAVRDAIELLDGMAVFTGVSHEVHVRVAEWHGNVYLDLCDDGWRCVEITTNGWTVRNGAPIRFKRTPGMLPLPVPEAGGDITDLRAFVNVTDDDWVLVIGWLLGALRPQGPYVVLNVTGEHGSAKTTVCRVLRRMTDPNTADDRAAPHDTRDLMIAATNGWVCAFDNLSWLRQGLSDDLARLSTGTGLSVRKLYENDEEQLFSACRPIILTGIEDVVTRPDLLDRTIVVEPPRLEKKKPEKIFWAGFDQARPRILGALLDAVAAALAGEDDVVLDNPPRMVDFARWVTAAEHTLGIEDFVGKYRASWHRAQGLALEGDDAANAIYNAAIRRRTWTGTAGELAELIKPDKPPKDWPTTGPKTAGLLRRIIPVLRLHGVDVQYNEHERPRTWTLKHTGDPEETDATDKVTETPSDQRELPVTSTVTRRPAADGSDGDADPVSQFTETDRPADRPDTPPDQERSQSVSSVTFVGPSLVLDDGTWIFHDRYEDWLNEPQDRSTGSLGNPIDSIEET